MLLLYFSITIKALVFCTESLIISFFFAIADIKHRYTSPDLMPSADPASFVQPGADFTRITPIDQKITVTLINEYISNTVQFLSDFLTSTDQRLNSIQRRSENCAALISILDAKLESIGVTAGSNGNLDNTASGDNRETTVSMQVPLMSDEATNAEVAQEELDVTELEEIEPEKPLFPPEYKRFVKMLKVGIHPLQVRMNLLREGMDADSIISGDGVVLINVQAVYDSLPDPPAEDD